MGPHVREAVRRAALPAVILAVGELSGEKEGTITLRGERGFDWWGSRQRLMAGA